MKLLAVGSVAFDSIRTPRGYAERVLGGSATYFSLAASYFAPSRVVGVVGEDFSAEHERILCDRGVCTRGIERAPGKSFFWEGEYESNPNIRHTLKTELNVFETFSPKLPHDYRDSSYLFLGNIDPVLQCQVCDQLPESRFVAGDTMNYWISSKPEQVREFLSRLDLLIVNDGEALQLTGETNLNLAARAIIQMGPNAVVIKRGEHGASLYSIPLKVASAAEAATAVTESVQDRLDYFAVPAYPLEDVFDPTGAGDSFAGGLMGYIAQQDAVSPATLRRAVVYGSVMGSFACERFGIERLRELSNEEVRRRYEEFAAFTSFEE